jgi:hypothetical protein
MLTHVLTDPTLLRLSTSWPDVRRNPRIRQVRPDGRAVRVLFGTAPIFRQTIAYYAIIVANDRWILTGKGRVVKPNHSAVRHFGDCIFQIPIDFGSIVYYDLSVISTQSQLYIAQYNRAGQACVNVAFTLLKEKGSSSSVGVMTLPGDQHRIVLTFDYLVVRILVYLQWLLHNVQFITRA